MRKSLVKATLISLILAGGIFANSAEKDHAVFNPYAGDKHPDLLKDIKKLYHPQHIINARDLHIPLPDGRRIANVMFAGKNSRKNVEYNKGDKNLLCGASVWVKSNPDIFTVIWDLYKHDQAMEYAILSKRPDVKKDSYGRTARFILVFQIPGYKPVEKPFYGNKGGITWDALIKEKDDSTFINPIHPSDWIDEYPLSPALLKARAENRKAINDGLIKKQQLNGGLEILPVNLSGIVISKSNGKPIKAASLWLKRNPYLMHRTREDGKFELLMREIVLRPKSKDQDLIMITAPHFEPKEINIDSYIKSDLKIELTPMPELKVMKTKFTDMVKLSAGFYRMGRGIEGHMDHHGGGTIELFPMTGWPIRTVKLPSFYISKTELIVQGGSNDKLVKIAKQLGYELPAFLQDNCWWQTVLLCNAMSEAEGRTPCYYTPDLKVWRTGLVEEPIVKWNANGYRLPTSAEWEYAAKAGTTTHYHWGNNWNPGCKKYALTHYDNELFARPNPNTIGLKLPNQFGLYDIIGNAMEEIWEWQGGVFPEVTYHPKGPSLKDTLILHQYMLRNWNSPRHLPYRMMRCSSFWCINIANKLDPWPGYGKKNYRGGGYSYENGVSWNEVQQRHGAYPSFEWECITGFRPVISIENIDDKIDMKSTFNPKANLPKPVKLDTIEDKIVLVDIPAGKFVMGGGQKHQNRDGAQTMPARLISISSFKMAKFETTMQQWKKVYNWGLQNGYDFENTGDMGKSSSEDLRHPVVNINWHDIIKWCNAASEMENLKPCYYEDNNHKNIYKKGTVFDPSCDWSSNGYRLPTEAEWEYAAHGGRNASFHWGYYQDPNLAWTNANHRSKNHIYFKEKIGVLHPVGQKPGSPYSVYDMIGNVYEYCWDYVAPYGFYMDKTENPKGPTSKKELDEFWKNCDKRNPLVPVKKDFVDHGDHKVIKGGSVNVKIDLHSYMYGVDTRWGSKPNEKMIDLGFRVVRGQ